MTTTIENLNVWNYLKEVPEHAKKTIRGGRMSGKTDINPMWRWHKLTERFGPCGVGWKFEITKVERHDLESGDEVVIFVYVSLCYQTGDGWSDPVPGVGGSQLVSKEKGGLYVDDDALKKATTDALGVAAKMIGLGSDVYSGNADWSKYSNAYKPSESPPPPEKKSPAKKAESTYKAALNYIYSMGGNREKIELGIKQAQTRLDESQLTLAEYNHLFIESLIETDQLDKATETLSALAASSGLAKDMIELLAGAIEDARKTGDGIGSTP